MARMKLPVGIERVLCVAAADEAFRSRLLEDPRRAVADHGLRLRDSELALLCAIPRPQLEGAVDAVDLSPDNVRRRGFLRAVAATAAGVAAADVLVACEDTDTPAGIRPLDDAAGIRPSYDATGIRPDMAPGDGTAAADGGATDADLDDAVADTISSLGIRPGG